MISTTLPPLDEIIEHGLTFDENGIPDKLSIDFITALEPYFIATSGKVNYYLLPPELNQLAEIEEDPIKPYPPECTILAAFDNKGLAARTLLIQLPHIEGTWVREDLRKGRVGYKLIKEMETTLLSAGRSHIFAFSETTDETISSYMERLGYSKMPLTIWSKNLTKD